MAQKKAHEVDGWLARPDPACRIVLIYGPDRGMVSERARSFVAKSGFPADDPFSVVRMDAGEFDREPGRLLDEAQTVPMFADRRLIWVRNAGPQKNLADDVKLLAADPPDSALILIEAGDLKKGTGLRGVVEAARSAIALPCYPDEGRSIDALIDSELEKAGMTIAMDARSMLRASLGGDRMASRGELEKLLLYAQGRSQVTADDVSAAIGDVAALSSDKVIDAVLGADLAVFERIFARVTSAGGQLQTMLSAAMRQFQPLHAARAAMESEGKGAQAAMAAMRPPVFFSRQKLVESALSRWDLDALTRILSRLQNVVLESRKRPDLAEALVRQAFIGIIAEKAGRRSR